MKHIPNILSFFRILLVPFIIWRMMNGDWLGAGILLVVSGLTDLLDGFLARRFGWVSQLGKVLDPAADKLTQVSVCVLLAIYMRAYWPLFVVLLFKDAVMLVLGSYLMAKKVKLDGARWFGKIATTLFYVTMVLILLLPGLPVWVVNTLLGLTVASALFSACMYIPQFVKYRGEAKKK